jgi:uncharacterized cupin superfamily protein
LDAPAGVVVSRISTEQWRPDPDVPGTEMHELVHADGVWAGLTRMTSVDGPVPWTPDQRETALVLEGSVRIEFRNGSSIELGPGDMASFPAGTTMTWHVTTPFKELWVLAG